MSDRNPKFAEQLASARPTTRHLVTSILFDAWPNDAAAIDFGIDSQKHYEALYFPVRQGEITPETLDAALGDGQKLTELVRAAASNPHKDVEYHTATDLILGRNDKAQTRTTFLSPLDAGDFWWCQGLTPPWEVQAGPDLTAAPAKDGKVSLQDLRNGSQEQDSREERQKAKSHDIER
ncbi:MAG: hypothetical protein NT142_10200 [Planctomycetota bacterium]|nr:hypothetical protein [Planctomycetota bacterium]